MVTSPPLQRHGILLPLTHPADELHVCSLNVLDHEDLHLGQEVQGHLIGSISVKERTKHTETFKRTL